MKEVACTFGEQVWPIQWRHFLLYIAPNLYILVAHKNNVAFTLSHMPLPQVPLLQLIGAKETTMHYNKSWFWSCSSWFIDLFLLMDIHILIKIPNLNDMYIFWPINLIKITYLTNIFNQVEQKVLP